jgi:DNA-binding MarR family transcriptional regulator
MNEGEKQKLIQNIGSFYTLFQKEILDLIPHNNLEISPLLSKVLHEIYLYADITPSILSKRLAITIPNTSRCLQKLTDSGHIIKIKDQKDKRITHIKLSPKGLSICENSFKLMDELMLNRVGVLELGDLTKLSEAFSILKDLFEKIGELHSIK